VKRPQQYKLEGREPVPCVDFMEWAQWFETADRHVVETWVHGCRVSTIFLGLDHSYFADRPPVLFETMVFGGPLHDTMRRYSTWGEAETGHGDIVEQVRLDTPSESVKARIARTSICDCGFPVFNENVPADFEFTVYPCSTYPSLMICGGCRREHRITLIGADATPTGGAGFIPREALTLCISSPGRP
jgi:hypothetical protein